MLREGSLQAIRYTSRPAVLLLLGCGVGLLVWAVGGGWYAIGGLGAIGIGVIGASFWKSKYQHVLVTIGLYLLLGACFGMYCESRYSTTRSIPTGDTLYDTDLIIRHPVAGSSSSPIRYTAEVDYHGSPITILLSIPSPQPIPEHQQYGGHYRATVDLRSLTEGGRLPKNSYHRYLLSEGYQATGVLQAIETKYPDTKRTLDDQMKYVRSRIIHRFESQHTTSILSDREKGVLYALTLGERAFLSRDIKEDFGSSGLAHILAVSGYHLGIVYLLLTMVLTFVIPAYRFRHVRFLLLFVGITAYALVCGASTATMRALLMSTLVLLAGMLGRPSDPIQTLSLTVVLLLIAQPLSFLNAGLVLSVSAVWGIVVFLPLFRTMVQPSSRILRYLGELIFVCFSAQLGVLPFLLLYFNKAILTIFWSNIPAVLLSGLLIPFGLFTLLASAVVPLPAFLLSSLNYLLSTFIEVIHFFGDISSDLTLKSEYDLVLVALYFGILHCIYLLAIRTFNRSQKQKLNI